jgi:cell wall-associated NlpC family hydrolase
VPPAPQPGLSFDQIAQAAYSAGFRGQALSWMTAIAMRESGGRTDAYNGNTRTGDNSWGLWQINTLGGNGPNIRRMLQSLGYSGQFSDLNNPTINAQVAFKLSSGGTNFEPWRSHSPGWEGPQGFLTNATQYLGAATTAAARVSLGGASAQTTQMRNITQAQGGQSGVYTQLAQWLTSKLGSPYKFGARGQNGNYDCSGLTAAAYDQLGIHMDALTWTQDKYGVAVNANDMQPGDLILVHGSQGNKGHVGIYMGGGQVVDAPHTGAVVRVTPLSDWTNRAQSVRRIIDSTGALITGPGITAPPHDASVRTTDLTNAVWSSSQTPLNLGQPASLTDLLGQQQKAQNARGPQNFTLDRAPLVLPGIGANAPGLRAPV